MTTKKSKKQPTELLQQLLQAIKQKDLPDEVIQELEQEIEQLSRGHTDNKIRRKQQRQLRTRWLQRLEKEYQLVPANKYMLLWLSVGMAAFGMPLGLIVGFSLDNMAFIGIGLPIGMSIGMAIGHQMDNKAKAEGRQLDWEE